MGNEEMGKREEDTLHFTQQTADVLLLQSSNVMRKSKSIHALTERSSLPDSWHKRGMQHNLQANSKYKKLKFFTYGSLLAFLKFVESVNCSYFPTLYKESF